MKRFHPIQIIVIAAVLVTSLLLTLHIYAQGEDAGPDDFPSAAGKREKHIVVLVDSTRSVAIYNNQLGGPLTDLISFTQFLVRYFNLFEPDVHIGVNIFGKEGADTRIASHPAGEWSEEELQRIQPIPCLEKGNLNDPCEDEEPSTSETMALAMDWAMEQNAPCMDDSQLSCYILLFTDGNYREELVKERLERIQAFPDIRIIPIAVGNYPINGPIGFTGPNNQHWQRPEYKNFISDVLDINDFYPQRSIDLSQPRLSEARKEAINRILSLLRYQESLISKPPGVILEYANDGYSREREARLNPEIGDLRLQIALSPGVEMTSLPQHTQISEGQYVWGRSSIEESTRFTLTGEGPVAYIYTESGITPTIEVQIMPETIYRGERITLSLALSTPYGTFDTNWIDKIHARVSPANDGPSGCEMSYQPVKRIWDCYFPGPTATGQYSITFDIDASRSDLHSVLDVPPTLFSVHPDQWRYDLKVAETPVEIGKPVTVTISTNRNGQPSTLPNGVTVTLVYTQGTTSTRVVLLDEESKELSNGFLWQRRLDEGICTLDAIIEYDPLNNIFEGNSVSFEVIPAPTSIPTATYTATPVPSPLPKEEPSASTTDEALASTEATTVSPTETATVAPTDTATPIETPTVAPTDTATPTETATATVTPTLVQIATPIVSLERDATSPLTHLVVVSMTQVGKNSDLAFTVDSSEVYTLQLISTQTLYTQTVMGNYWSPRSITVILREGGSTTFSQTIRVPSVFPASLLAAIILLVLIIIVLLYVFYGPLRTWVHGLYYSITHRAWILQRRVNSSFGEIDDFIRDREVSQLMVHSLNGQDSAAAMFIQLLLRWSAYRNKSALDILHYPGISKILSRNIEAAKQALTHANLSSTHMLLWREYLVWIEELDKIEMKFQDGMLDMNSHLRDLVLVTWKKSRENLKRDESLHCYVDLLDLLIKTTKDIVEGRPLLDSHGSALAKLRQDCRKDMPEQLIPLVDLFQILDKKSTKDFIESPWDNKEEHSNLETYFRDHNIVQTLEGKVFHKILLQVWLLRR